MVSLLADSVEIDETHVGGKPRMKDQSECGRGTAKKSVLVQRDGNEWSQRSVGQRARDSVTKSGLGGLTQADQ